MGGSSNEPVSALEREESALLRVVRAVSSPAFSTDVPAAFDCYDKGRMRDAEHLRSLVGHAILYAGYLNVTGAVVLDVGAGLGLQSCVFALRGAAEVIAYDISPEFNHAQRRLVSAFDPPLGVEPRVADWVTSPAPPETADAILMQESLSHIRDTKKALASAVEALRPGGRLLISDANNSFWPGNVVHSLRAYRRSEYGAGATHPGARAVDRKGSYQARKDIIATAIPGLDERALNRLGRKTKGLYGEDLLRAAAELNKTGRTTIRADFPYRNPYTGEFPELLVSPLRLRRELKALGLRCEFLPQPRHWRRGVRFHPVNLAKHMLAAASKFGPEWSRPFFGRAMVLRGTKPT